MEQLIKQTKDERDETLSLITRLDNVKDTLAINLENKESIDYLKKVLIELDINENNVESIKKIIEIAKRIFYTFEDLVLHEEDEESKYVVEMYNEIKDEPVNYQKHNCEFRELYFPEFPKALIKKIMKNINDLGFYVDLKKTYVVSHYLKTKAMFEDETKLCTLTTLHNIKSKRILSLDNTYNIIRTAVANLMFAEHNYEGKDKTVKDMIDDFCKIYKLKFEDLKF